MATTSSAALDLSALERPVLTDCAKIYIDLGLNIGLNFERLFEPERFRRRSEPMRSMDLLFGNSSERRRDVCALGFEPNPRHQAGLRRLERRLRNRGHSVHIFAAAIAAGSELNISSKRPRSQRTKRSRRCPAPARRRTGAVIRLPI